MLCVHCPLWTVHTASGEAGAAVALGWGEAQAGRHEPRPTDPQGQGSLCHLVFIFPEGKNLSHLYLLWEIWTRVYKKE